MQSDPNTGNQYDGPNEDLIYYTFRPGNAEELKQSIEAAFAEAVFPGDGDADIIVSGYPGCCAECGETHAMFCGKHWREVAASETGPQDFGWGGLALLTSAAWKFYLPAYLIISLSGGEGAENAQDCAISALTPWPPKGLEALGGGVIDYVKQSADWFAARAFSFTGAQLDCLAAYMAAVGQSDVENGDWKALAAYWAGRAAEARAEGYVEEPSRGYSAAS